MKKKRWYYVLTVGITMGALVGLFIQPICAGTDPYAASNGQSQQEKKEHSIVPWVVGGLLVGGGAAAAIAASGGGGGGSDDSDSDADPAASPTASATATPEASVTPTPTPTPGGSSSTSCEDTDAMGEWKAPSQVDGEYTTTQSFRLFAGYSASFEETRIFTPADGSPGSGATQAFIGGWSLSTSDCMLTLNGSGGSGFDGSGQISGGTVEINGVTYTKQ